jgi:AcrR family transcriptional regulator
VNTSSTAETGTDGGTVTRLLDAAARLFYEQGVGVGIAALCEAAGVSKRSMYQYFDSKDEVLAAALARSAPGHLARLLPGPYDTTPPRARILGVFERIEQTAADPGYRGCPFVSIASEVKVADHPARAVAREFHDQLTAFFRGALVEAGVRRPDLLAQQLTAVHDGFFSGSSVQGRPLRGLATSMAATLLDAAQVGTSRRSGTAAAPST